MPVVNLNLDRFKEMLGTEISQDLIIEKLPYLGLDIEDISNSDMRIEYNPNRLDYSSDYGIARGLKGLLDIDLGCPTYNVSNGSVEVIVDPSVQRIRPYIVSAIIKNLNLNKLITCLGIFPKRSFNSIIKLSISFLLVILEIIL